MEKSEVDQGPNSPPHEKRISIVNSPAGGFMADTLKKKYFVPHNADVSRVLRLSNGTYNNPWDTWTGLPSFFTTPFKMLFKMARVTEEDKKLMETKHPVLKPNWELIKSPNPKVIQLIWIGHSSFLIQIDGLTFLTDPCFCERCSPVSFAGPRRYREPPFQLSEIPHVDFVVISHSHYDHLEEDTVKRMPAHVLWLVPEGTKKWFVDLNVHNVIEFDWWEECELAPGFFVRATPCQHWSNRSLFDINETLWCSWAIQGPSGRKIFFGGDTGYCSCFKEIGRVLGPFDLALIPIGAYCPRDVLRAQHVDPEEAVKIHQDIKSKKSIGCHWGTWILSGEPVLEPPQKLAEAASQAGLRSDEFIVVKIGEVNSFAAISDDDSTDQHDLNTER